jgi:uncharacterized protein YdhG (YjbR/CyaY superfamily)
MKKLKPAHRKPAAKGRGTPRTVEDYLASVPPPALDTFNKLRAVIRSAVPSEASETISYKIPAFRHNGIVVWFAAFKDHCSLFPTAAVLAEFKKDLKGFATSKGTVQFPLDEPLPAALVKKLVKARVAQMRSKNKK